MTKPTLELLPPTEFVRTDDGPQPVERELSHRAELSALIETTLTVRIHKPESQLTGVPGTVVVVTRPKPENDAVVAPAAELQRVTIDAGPPSVRMSEGPPLTITTARDELGFVITVEIHGRSTSLGSRQTVELVVQDVLLETDGWLTRTRHGEVFGTASFRLDGPAGALPEPVTIFVKPSAGAVRLVMRTSQSDPGTPFSFVLSVSAAAAGRCERSVDHVIRE